MIEYIKGNVFRLTPTDVTVETGSGVGYLLNISLNTYTPLNGQKECMLWVHEVIREDAHILYGFLTEHERELFRLLIGVSGVGASIARMILSSVPPAELEQVITQGAAARLKSVKGIGAKTAERIIVDLKDKIKPTGDTLFIQETPRSEVYEEALAAMVMLGFPKPQAQKVMKKLFEANPSLKVEDAIKKGLTMM
ncbi:MAG: Holliday junction branch migration protein RuvA [Muribaculaceae bacterium]|nr:Holliday junction branch migration protein RuvA [Muribaculaceae bacterium]